MNTRYFENLESRQMLSATLDNGLLRVEGTNANDVISVSQFSTTMRTTVNGRVSDFALSAVRSILVNARAGHDRVTLGDSVTRPATINGGAGNDTLTGGAGNDVIYGGSGNDLIYGGRGNDKLFGGDNPTSLAATKFNSSVVGGLFGSTTVSVAALSETDHDTIYGGAGNDTIRGGAGNDKLYGEAGDDVLYGEAGNDALFGGDGRDSLYGGAGRDTLDGGRGIDFLDGGADIDHIPSNDGDVIQVGSHRVWGAIGIKWVRMGGEGGFLGAPTTSETATPDGVGRYNHFRGGSIYWTPATGANAIWGAIRDKWASMGWERSALGYPTSDETPVVGGGRMSTFQNGDIFWSPLTGAQVVRMDMMLATDSPQYDDWSCGPNSVSRVLRFYGINASYSQVRSVQLRDTDLVSRFKMGSRPTTLHETMKRWKADAQLERRTSFDRVISVLASGKPVVALLGWGRDYTFALGTTPGTLHWVALSGFDAKTQTIFYTDTDGGRKQMSYTEFNQKWNWYSSGSKGAFLTGTLGVQERTILY